MKRKILILLLTAAIIAGCKKDVLDPLAENIRDKDVVYKEPIFAQGILTNGYLRLPYEDFVYGFNDVATDDAVSNDPTNPFFALATGQWRTDNNAMDFWTRGYNGILYMNLILAEADKVKWAEDEQASNLFKLRIKGEAYGLRAIFMYYLLQAHGGPRGGNVLGLPILTEAAENITDYNIPRADLNTYINAIYKDMDVAEDYLPLDYNDLNVNSGVVPQKYVLKGITANNVTAYNRTMGLLFRGRVNGRILKAFRSKLALMVASPAFLNGSGDSWTKAAQTAADVISINNGLGGLPTNGWTFYNNADITSIVNGSNPPEIIWRARTLTHSNISSTIEKQHFPPSLFGNGRLNPTQNLVDAFPMKNGYPINISAQSGYDPANPYKDRDPRLDAYIVVNGSRFGPSNTVINTMTGGDGVGVQATSTVTGYYMRKLLNQTTNLNPATPATKLMYVARIRYTEIYLNYAEAANEAYGPDGIAPGATYSARDILRTIRRRAGVGGTSDPYLSSISSKDDMREMIKNERRLELCFEGHRFWDLRRWKVPLTKLNEVPRGIAGRNAAGQLVFDLTGPYPVENQRRAYQNHMYYGPIPYFETLKFSNLPQNEGW